MNTTISIAPLAQTEDKPIEWLDRLDPDWIRWGVYAAIALIALLVLRRIWRGLTRTVRRRRPPTIHPRLQKYNIDHAELDRTRREQAAGIIATSTGSRLAGFRIERQVEAVFVEDHRTPEQALIALKATAAERGANALLNVRTERTTANRCAASADAVFATPIVPRNNKPIPPK